MLVTAQVMIHPEFKRLKAPLARPFGLGICRHGKRCVIKDVVPGGNGERAGFQKGDIIVRMNDYQGESYDDFMRYMDNQPKHLSTQIVVSREVKGKDLTVPPHKAKGQSKSGDHRDTGGSRNQSTDRRRDERRGDRRDDQFFTNLCVGMLLFLAASWQLMNFLGSDFGTTPPVWCIGNEDGRRGEWLGVTKALICHPCDGSQNQCCSEETVQARGNTTFQQVWSLYNSCSGFPCPSMGESKGTAEQGWLNANPQCDSWDCPAETIVWGPRFTVLKISTFSIPVLLMIQFCVARAYGSSCYEESSDRPFLVIFYSKWLQSIWFQSILLVFWSLVVAAWWFVTLGAFRDICSAHEGSKCQSSAYLSIAFCVFLLLPWLFGVVVPFVTRLAQSRSNVAGEDYKEVLDPDIEVGIAA